MRRRRWLVPVFSIALLSGSIRLNGQSPSEATKQDATSSSALGSTATVDSLTPPSVTTTQHARMHLTVYPAKVVSPELRYPLWPSPRELKPGDAQTNFYRALLMLRSKPNEVIQQLNEWSELPTSELPIEKVEADLQQFHDLFLELERVALREDQSLDLHIRELEGDAVYFFLLPEMQEARTLARLLKLKSIVQVQKSDYEAAIATWRMMFRLAGLVGNNDIVISQLVGVAIASQAFESIEQAIVRPDCPNLYWSLATLPRPLINFRKSMAIERDAYLQVFPFLRDAHRLELTPEEWHKRLIETFASVQKLHGEMAQGSQVQQQIKLAMLLSFASGSDANAMRQRLQAAGWTEQSLSSMSVYQLVALDTAQQLRYWSDRTYAPFLLPASVARPLLAERARELQEWTDRESGHSMAAYILGLMMPALQNVHNASLRSEMVLNQLMTIEAIRLQIASDGRLPASLNDLSTVPAMLDPTGQPFEYSLEASSKGTTAILKSRATDLWPDGLNERRLTVGGVGRQAE